jgi:hypothetical protein
VWRYARPVVVGPMALLTTVPGAFPARVLAARLGSEGFLWELRGNVDGPYPIGAVQVLVAASELRDAQELLLADEIDAIDTTGADEDDEADGPVGAAPVALWLVLLAIVSVPALSLGRILAGY